MDANTAMYSLHLYGGVGDVYEYENSPNEIIRCEIVGLLQDSILQGEIMMGEENFLTLFPEVNGYQYFLFESRYKAEDGHFYRAAEFDDRTLQIVHDLLGDYGFQGEPTADRLRKLFAIQNTYLSTFQSLGGIGLLVGIFGLAVIQSRNVLERRKELALLLAIGFTKSRVILLLLYESFTLLAWGLGLAVVASAFALLPFFVGSVQQVSAVSVLYQFVILVGGLLLVGIVSNVAAALAVLKIPVARELAEER
jgi:ABC-type antimicrobial peptide transport system permease subunit